MILLRRSICNKVTERKKNVIKSPIIIKVTEQRVCIIKSPIIFSYI